MTPQSFVPVIYGVAIDRPDDAAAQTNAATVADALRAEGFTTAVFEVGLNLNKLRHLVDRQPAAVFNLVESMHGDGRLGQLVPITLDYLGLAHTGAQSDSYFITNSKLLTKRLLRSAGLPTPDWWLDGAAVPRDCRVIIKSVLEHGSFGMDCGSIVAGDQAVEEITARQQRFGGTFFAEEFVDGREFNISILETPSGPRVLPIPEMRFDTLPPGRAHIVDYEAKWDSRSEAYHNTPRRFGLEDREPALAATLGHLARTVWAQFGLSGYARVDVRVDMDRRPAILEVNANPCLAPDAGFAAAAQQSWIGYNKVIRMIVLAAMRRGKYITDVPHS